VLESVVLVPAIDAGRLVTDLRIRHDPSAAKGVPPHLTLMYPFIPAPDLTEPVIDQLLPALPITIRAEEAWLMVGTKSTSWTVVRKMRLCG
jgi:hypothetical protein